MFIGFSDEELSVVHPLVTPFHPRGPGLSAGGSEGTSRDTVGGSIGVNLTFPFTEKCVRQRPRNKTKGVGRYF